MSIITSHVTITFYKKSFEIDVHEDHKKIMLPYTSILHIGLSYKKEIDRHQLVVSGPNLASGFVEITLNYENSDEMQKDYKRFLYNLNGNIGEIEKLWIEKL